MGQNAWLENLILVSVKQGISGSSSRKREAFLSVLNDGQKYTFDSNNLSISFFGPTCG